ncbi:MAG: bifunctional folylpolyglutamate synthase/dihydrofolate synthase [Desulfovibrionales bacterium]
MKPGLERVEAALERLAPLSLPPLVQIVGTNGKGSTAHFLTAIARAHGLKTCLYTSPHFVSVRERILVDGGMLEERIWVDLANQVEEKAGDLELTYFEFLTVMAVLAAVDTRADVGVFEAGLGGSFDATTALQRQEVLFCPISLDHQEILGRNVATIARDKSGALRPGMRAVTARQPEAAMRVLQQQCMQTGVECLSAAELYRFDSDQIVDQVSGDVFLEAVELGLPGQFQQENAIVALAGWSVFCRITGWSLRPQACKQGLSRAWLPGRLQLVSGNPDIILDGAHNASGLQTLARELETRGIRPEAVIFTCLEDKDIEVMADLVVRLGSGTILVPELDNPRAMGAEDLALRIGPPARAVASLKAALDGVAAAKGSVLVCGSLYLLGEFYRMFPHALHRSARRS